MPTRRAFCKTLAGALLLPGLRRPAQTAADRGELLRRFCADPQEDAYILARYDLDRPFVRDAWAFASDGRSAARIDAGGCDTDSPIRVPKSIVQVWDSHWRDRPGWRRLPPRRLTANQGPTDWALCPTCRAARLPECPRCEGFGTVSIDPTVPSTRVCPDCRGKGVLVPADCPDCGGAYNAPNLPFAVEMAHGVYLDGYYYDRLASLPDVRWNVGAQKALVFRSEAKIEGLVMVLDWA